MTKEVQLAGGSADIEKTYTGPDRELRVDTTNKDLRLHDGTTPGGHLIPSRDNNDERYQARSEELAGIGPYTAEQRGFLARRGAGSYRLRRIIVSSEFALTNPDGYNGDPSLELSGTINKELRFTEQQIFERTVAFEEGIIGDTEGTHYGPMEGNLTGNVVGNSLKGTLTGALFGPSSGMHTGGLKAAGYEVQFANGQLLLQWISGIENYVRNTGVPIGAIILWSGAVESIPVGWALCDGNNSTPDLRDRFVVGAGNSYAPGSTGGSNTHTHAATTPLSGGHDHGLIVNYHELTIAEMPAHTHRAFGSRYGDNHAPGADPALFSSSGDSTFPAVTSYPESTVTGSGNGHGHGLTVGSNGAHTHTVNVTSADSRPLYYALCYIMHVGV